MIYANSVCEFQYVLQLCPTLCNCISVWCLEIAMAWLWWTTFRKLCSSTWEHQSCTALLTPIRDSLAPHAKQDSPQEVSCSNIL